jgi:xylulokinase
MPAPAILLGLDVTTDGVGALAITGDGKVLAAVRRDFTSETGASTAAEWWRAARTAIKDTLRRAALRPEQIRAIGITGAPGAVAALDRAGDLLATCSWSADASSHLAEVVAKAGIRNLANLAGGVARPDQAAALLRWLQASHKRAWHDCHLVLAPKDLIRFRLCGTAGTDAGDAAATGLFNPKTRAWSKQLLTWFDVAATLMPPVASGAALAGRVLEAAAKDAGLQAGTPVVVGPCHASALAIVGGMLDASGTVVELGGAGIVCGPTAEAARDPAGRLRTACHSLGPWTLETDQGASQAHIATVFRTYLPTLAAQTDKAGRSFATVAGDLAAAAPAGGPVALPGGATDLPADAAPAVVARAAIDGGLLAARQAVTAIEAIRGGPSARLVVAGSAAGQPLWLQAAADAFGRPVHAVRGEEIAAAGAAVLAATAAGIHKTVPEAVAKMIRDHTTIHPKRPAAEALAAVAARIAAA